MLNYHKVSADHCSYYRVASIGEIPNGERIFFDINAQPVVLFNIGGNFFAIGDVCSHDDGPLGDGDLADFVIKCPRHGATFDVRSGKALTLPAVIDIPAYPIRVVDGQIEVGIPD
jgi:3-phenylpropionate/trans-cinnamate dioxygenase ferredoxin subunit